MAMAQTQIEHTKRPIMTVFTIQCACQNSVKRERSDDVSGKADCATSAGFIGTSLSALRLRRSYRRGASCETHVGAPGEFAHALDQLEKFRENSCVHHRQTHGIPAKLGQTRA